METIVTTRSEGLRSLPWRSLGVWLLVGLLVGVFVLDVALPGVVLLPFMCRSWLQPPSRAPELPASLRRWPWPSA